MSHFVHKGQLNLEVQNQLVIPVSDGLSPWLVSGDPEIPVLRLHTVLE